MKTFFQLKQEYALNLYTSFVVMYHEEVFDKNDIVSEFLSKNGKKELSSNEISSFVQFLFDKGFKVLETQDIQFKD